MANAPFHCLVAVYLLSYINYHIAHIALSNLLTTTCAIVSAIFCDFLLVIPSHFSTQLRFKTMSRGVRYHLAMCWMNSDQPPPLSTHQPIIRTIVRVYQWVCRHLVWDEPGELSGCHCSKLVSIARTRIVWVPIFAKVIAEFSSLIHWGEIA